MCNTKDNCWLWHSDWQSEPSSPAGSSRYHSTFREFKEKSSQKEPEGSVGSAWILPVRGPYAEEDAATAHGCFTVITQIPPHSPQIFITSSCTLHPALGSCVLLPPLCNGVMTEQVLGKGDARIPKQHVSVSQLCPRSCAPFGPAPRMLSRSSMFLCKAALLKAQWVVGQSDPLCTRPLGLTWWLRCQAESHSHSKVYSLSIQQHPPQPSSAQQSNHPALATLVGQEYWTWPQF